MIIKENNSPKISFSFEDTQQKFQIETSGKYAIWIVDTTF